MKTVFISYSRDDLDIVENEIVSEIERINGVKCWLDIHDIEAGAESFPNVIKQGLEDCFIFLIMLSKSSMQKEWPHTELKDAENFPENGKDDTQNENKIEEIPKEVLTYNKPKGEENDDNKRKKSYSDELSDAGQPIGKKAMEKNIQ